MNVCLFSRQHPSLSFLIDDAKLDRGEAEKQIRS